MKTVLFTGGTSILTGLTRSNVTLKPGFEQASLTDQVVLALPHQVSAEVATLFALKTTATDRVVFYGTDSEPGTRCAEINATIATGKFGCEAVAQTIPGLVLDDPERFRQQGLPALIEALDREIGAAAGGEVVICVSAGIKALVPYLAIYAMLRRADLCYLFEKPEVLVRLPRLPLSFDMEAIRLALPVLSRIEQATALPQRRVQDELGSSFEVLEGLFQPCGSDMLTLSPFGLALLADLNASEDTTVLLSPSARKTFGETDGIAKTQFALMLARSRNPLWRRSKYHRFEGTDLDVYKPGNTAQRMAAWVEPNRSVYVAELYANHDAYERELNGRRRADYNPADFSPWSPDIQEALSSDEQSGQDLLDRVARERARQQSELVDARREVEAALDLAATTDREGREALASAEAQLRDQVATSAELKQHLAHASTAAAAAEQRIAAFESAPLLRRLMAAIRAQV